MPDGWGGCLSGGVNAHYPVRPLCILSHAVVWLYYFPNLGFRIFESVFERS